MSSLKSCTVNHKFRDYYLLELFGAKNYLKTIIEEMPSDSEKEMLKSQKKVQ